MGTLAEGLPGLDGSTKCAVPPVTKVLYCDVDLYAER